MRLASAPITRRAATPSWRRLRGSATKPSRFQAASALLGTVAGSLFVGYAVGDGYGLVLMLMALTIALVLVLTRWPGIGPYLAALSIMVPYTWSRSTGTSVVAYPLLVAIILGCAALPRLGTHKVNPGVFDWLVAVLILDVGLSETATGLGYSLLLHQILNIGVPYFGLRIFFTAYPKTIESLPRALIIVGIVAVGYSVYEELIKANPVSTLSHLYNPSLSRWTRELVRAGVVRVSSFFGQPIAFGSFLVIPAVLTFAKRQWISFGVLTLGIGLTLSRGPYIALIVSLLLMAAVQRRVTRVAVVLAVVAVVATQIGPVSRVVVNSFSSGTAETSTTEYRGRLLSTSIDDLTFWGQPVGSSETSQLFQGQGLSDLTSYLALTVARTGIPGMMLWLFFLVYLGRTLLLARRQGDELLAIFTVALIGCWVSLLSVALITNFQYVVWLVLGAAAARATIGRRERFAPASMSSFGEGGRQLIALDAP